MGEKKDRKREREEEEKEKEKEKEKEEVEESVEDEVVMETPVRKCQGQSQVQIATPMSKFEDSPVFNFLNNLSPIKPVKSTHITQTFNALSFASLPSVFTSPHVTSLKESRFLRRHQLPDPSKPEFSSEVGNKTNDGEMVINVPCNSAEQQQSFCPQSSGGEVSLGTSHECPGLPSDLARPLKYDFGSPKPNLAHSCATAVGRVSEFACVSGPLVPYVQEVSETGIFGSQLNVETLSLTDQNREATGGDWENLISDAADLLVFDSPSDTEAYRKDQDHEGRFYASAICIAQTAHSFGAGGSGERLGDGSETENVSTQPGDESEVKENAETQAIICSSSLSNDCIIGDSSEKMDNEHFPSLCRGMRRRCLVFEMAGGRRKHLDGSSSSGASTLRQPEENAASNANQLVPAKTRNEPSRCVLPGIGLHLNALATTPKEYNVVKNEAVTSGRQLVIAPNATPNFHSTAVGQGSSSRSLALISSEIESGHAENKIHLLEDAPQTSGLVNEELNQTSPKKKRRRLEHAGDSEVACKRCNCKKSKCLKLYCECFAAGVYCVEPCACQDCYNKPIHEDTVLATRKQIESRNPLAFAPKVIRSSDSLSETGDDSSKTPASARHKRGCNCKKSGCLKKYCECYQGGVGCSINCRCEGCKNAFGRKDGSLIITAEADLEEEEIDVSEKSVMDRNLTKITVQNENIDSALHATPLRFGRQTIQLPFSSKNKPPRSFLPVGSSSGYFSNQGLGKSNFFQPQSKFDNRFETNREDEIPEILQSGSPINGVKSSSPNSKRVSPPHSERGISSPGRRSSRKLILQSIPSFPSLTPKH